MAKKYRDFEEFEKDLNHFKSNPGDLQFMLKMVNRAVNSKDDVRQVLKDHLENRILEAKPELVMKKIVKADTRLILKVKSKEDPWFLI